MKYLDTMRREYTLGGLRREDLAEQPIAQFEHWLQQAIDYNLPDPTAMTVATVSDKGQPSQRIVLLKSVNQDGFVFYTNLGSRKARELENDARVSLHFPWHLMERQVVICGTAEKVSSSEAEDYFATRPRQSQLAAWTSKQSQTIASRAELMNRYSDITQGFNDQSVPLPEFWGGFRVSPHEVEFWQGGEHRLHDRFRYQLDQDQQWQIERLMP
jgi:pyridoxamine 5'-phosphate oxidase